MTEKKIFISHSSKDKEIVREVVELLESIGVKSESIFCSSFEGYGTRLGDNFLDCIRKELTDDTLVLFVLTTNFFNSHMCQCELGAVWVKTLKHIPILVPPLTYNDLEQLLSGQQAMIINDRNALASLNESIINWFDLVQLKPSIWTLKSDKFIGNVNEIIKKNYVM